MCVMYIVDMCFTIVHRWLDLLPRAHLVVFRPKALLHCLQLHPQDLNLPQHIHCMQPKIMNPPQQQRQVCADTSMVYRVE
jgi:hypothetical protein